MKSNRRVCSPRQFYSRVLTLLGRDYTPHVRDPKQRTSIPCRSQPRFVSNFGSLDSRSSQPPWIPADDRVGDLFGSAGWTNMLCSCTETESRDLSTDPSQVSSARRYSTGQPSLGLVTPGANSKGELTRSYSGEESVRWPQRMDTRVSLVFRLHIRHGGFRSGVSEFPAKLQPPRYDWNMDENILHHGESRFCSPARN